MRMCDRFPTCVVDGMNVSAWAGISLYLMDVVPMTLIAGSGWKTAAKKEMEGGEQSLGRVGRFVIGQGLRVGIYSTISGEDAEVGITRDWTIARHGFNFVRAADGWLGCFGVWPIG